jgi:hypothetical protein
MRLNLALAAGLALLAFAAPSLAAAAPRDNVDQVAAAIAAGYFDPVKGKAVADDLRAAAAKGQFDALTDPRDLATALTARLQPLDHHFSVMWSPPAPAPMQGSPRRPGPMAAPGADRIGNYGFHRLEMLPEGIAYIDLRGFANINFGDPKDPARRAADTALDFAANADAVILDLRENGGGSPAMVGYLTSGFTRRDADIYNTFHSRGGSFSEKPGVYRANPRLDVPVYILTSGRSASAAEALAYTLQSAGRARTVGEASAGGANPGGFVELGDGLRVFVSNGSTTNPITHRNWEGTGVKPDLPAPASTALRRARMAALEDILAKPGAAIEAQWTLDTLRAEAQPPKVDLAAYAGAFGAAVVSVQDGHLSLQREHRPAWVLTPLGGDLFTVVDDPTRRVRFERDPAGTVTAMEQLYAAGFSARFLRGV